MIFVKKSFFFFFSFLRSVNCVLFPELDIGRGGEKWAISTFAGRKGEEETVRAGGGARINLQMS